MYRLVAGELQVNIAVALNISEARLSIIVNSPMFKKEMRKLEDAVFDNVVATRGDISGRVSKLQPTALTVIEDMMKSKKTPMRLKRDCAKDILEMDQKNRSNGEDDGRSPFARMIDEAFKMAETAKEEPLTDPSKQAIEVDSMELNSETGLPIDPVEDDPSEVEENEGVSGSVEEVLGEMGIMNPAELKNAS